MMGRTTPRVGRSPRWIHRASVSPGAPGPDAPTPDRGWPEAISMRQPRHCIRPLVAGVTPPPETQLLFLRLQVNVQAPDAACWLDDVALRPYPQ